MPGLDFDFCKRIVCCVYVFVFCTTSQDQLTLHFFMYSQIEANRSVVSPAPVLSHDISLLRNLACQQIAPTALCSTVEIDDLRGAPLSSLPATSMTSVSFLGVQVLIQLY